MAEKTIQFYADVDDESLLEHTSYYKFDIHVLEEIANEYDYHLRVGTSPSDLIDSADVYFAWWATTSISPIIRSKFARSHSIIVAGGSEVVTSVPEDLSIMYSSRPFWQKLIIRFCLQVADTVVTPSEHMAEEVSQLGVQNPVIVPNCIDTSIYTPSTPKSEYLPYPSDEYFLTIVKYAQSSLLRKEVFTLLDGLNQADSQIPLVFAGGLVSENIYDQISQYANKIGVANRVTFLTDISEQQKIELLRGARLYIQPTLHEAFGVALTEAMACETPVISTKRGAVPEVVGDTGYYAKTNDPADLAKTIDSASTDRFRMNNGELARKRVVERFSLSTRKQQISDFIIPHL